MTRSDLKDWFRAGDFSPSPVLGGCQRRAPAGTRRSGAHRPSIPA
jgi:hypothetical protein